MAKIRGSLTFTWHYVIVTGPSRGLRDAYWKVETSQNEPFLLSCLVIGGNAG